MRMIGIGLLGFLLAGLALLLSTVNILEHGRRYIHEATGGPQLVFENRNIATGQDTHIATILRSGSDHPVLLSGFPAYQSIAFSLPVDARPTSGYLQVDATSQVLDGVEGVLRISIRNTRRGEMLLRSGEVGRSLKVLLSPRDFAGDQLVVSFSLQGTGSHSQCGPQDGLEAIVEIETTSAVYLTLDGPLSSSGDQIRAWGNTVRVAWPDWLAQDEQLRRLVLATQFDRHGLSPVFSEATEDAFSTNQMRDALTTIPLAQPQEHETEYLAQAGANAGLRRFYGQAAWRHGFDLSSSREPRLQNQLDLQMQLGRLVGNQPWVLTVTLNKQLIFHDHFAGPNTEFHAVIDLPVEMQSATNTLEVMATVSSQQDSVCDQGPELVAEMLPSTRLIPSETPFEDPLSDVHTALFEIGLVNVAMMSELTAIDAAIASRMLDQLIPAGTEIKPAGDKTHVTVLGADDQAPLIPDSRPAWLIANDSTGNGLNIVHLQPNEDVRLTGLSLLVTPSTVPSEEREE